jgi:hypothetical protein
MAKYAEMGRNREDVIVQTFGERYGDDYVARWPKHVADRLGMTYLDVAMALSRILPSAPLDWGWANRISGEIAQEHLIPSLATLPMSEMEDAVQAILTQNRVVDLTHGGGLPDDDYFHPELD